MNVCLTALVVYKSRSFVGCSLAASRRPACAFWFLFTRTICFHFQEKKNLSKWSFHFYFRRKKREIHLVLSMHGSSTSVQIGGVM